MPLVKDTLKSALTAILSDTSPEKKPEDVADKIATAIDAYIKTATIGTPTGPGTIA